MQRCYLCESEKTRRIVDWGDYKIFKCLSCNVIFATPLPDDETLKQYYQGFLFNLPYDNEIKQQIRSRKKELTRLFRFTSADQNKRFLDYGGGTGAAYQAARELNLNAYYQDWDQAAAAFVQTHYQLNEQHYIRDLNTTKLRFDFIFSDNVIEHVTNPVKYLQEIGNALDDQGIAIIKTPHGGNTVSYFYPLITLRGYFLKVFKSGSLMTAIKTYYVRIWHCDPPRHLFSFSAESLRHIARKAGFDPMNITIEFYNLPLFKYSLTKIFLDFNNHRGFNSHLKRAIMLPLIPVEICSKILQISLLTLGILSPAGIILILKKTRKT